MARNVLTDMHGGIGAMQYSPGEVIHDWWTATRDAYNWGAKRGLWGDGTLIWSPSNMMSGANSSSGYRYDNGVTEEYYEDVHELPHKKFVLNEYVPLTLEEEGNKYDQLLPYLDENAELYIDYPDGNPYQNIAPKQRKKLQYEKDLDEYYENPENFLPELDKMEQFVKLVRNAVSTMEGMNYKVVKIQVNKERTEAKIDFIHNTSGETVTNTVQL